jgi:hypothetical protein
MHNVYNILYDESDGIIEILNVDIFLVYTSSKFTQFDLEKILETNILA